MKNTIKKIILPICILLLTTGCVCIQNASLDEIVDNSINRKYDLYNHSSKGFKYYLPRELTSIKTDEYNEVIKSKYYDYYLYVDLISYYNKALIEYHEDENIFYSKLVENDDYTGIINVFEEKENFLIKATYHYATIEVKCKKEDVNEVLDNVLTILTTIKYNDEIIENILGEDILASVEEQINVFKIESSETDTLSVDDTYTGNEEEDYDPDVIRER